jgi:hypothetical protein
LQRIEDRGCVYLPRVNAFCIREFKMMYAAEEAARFLHHACRGLPRLNEQDSAESPGSLHARVVEDALGYLGSRILYPARPAMEADAEFGRDGLLNFRNAVRENPGYALGSRLYEDYLSGAVTRNRLRHLFLAHLDPPELAQKLCAQLGLDGLGRKGPYSDYSSFPRRALRSRLF